MERGRELKLQACGPPTQPGEYKHWWYAKGLFRAFSTARDEPATWLHQVGFWIHKADRTKTNERPLLNSFKAIAYAVGNMTFLYLACEYVVLLNKARPQRACLGQHQRFISYVQRTSPCSWRSGRRKGLQQARLLVGERDSKFDVPTQKHPSLLWIQWFYTEQLGVLGFWHARLE